MDNNSNYFYLSGLISLSLFGVMFALFVHMLFSVNSLKSFALNKENYISISLEMPNLTTKSKKKNVQSAPVESLSETPSQNVDVNDLFSDVWTRKIVKKEPKPVNSKRIQEIQKRIKKAESNSVKSIAEKVNTSETVQSKELQNSSSSAEEVNEYLAKIQAIVYQHFHVPPNSQGSSVKTVIELNALGKVLDFRVLTYSANSALNAEADKIKDRLKSVIFPLNPQNKSIRTIVILISKE
jgi:periplasmic protein TonB